MKRLVLYDFLFEEDRTKALKKRVYEAPDEEEKPFDENGERESLDSCGVDNVIGPDGEEKTVAYVDVVWSPIVTEEGIVRYAKKLLKGVLMAWAEEVERLEVSE